ncbi:MAG: lyase-like protein [Candidatus Eremiobacteraeota bacterium]|nr:lyase-like protein [Candidatus Eremiobacteraeota bacterium]
MVSEAARAFPIRFHLPAGFRMFRRFVIVAAMIAAFSGCGGRGSHAVPTGAPGTPASSSKLSLAVPAPPPSLAVPARTAVLRTTPAPPDRSAARSPRTTGHAAFFTGEAALSNGVYYLQFANGNVFGYYSYLSDSRYIYHFDLGYEYVSDANDGKRGVYLYDFASGHWWYTSPAFAFPYVYDFSLNAFLYYYPDTKNAGHYTTSPRYFFNFANGQIITLPGPQPNPSALSFAGGSNLTQQINVSGSSATVDASGCSGIASVTAVNASTFNVTPGQPGSCWLIVIDQNGGRSALHVLVTTPPTASVTDFPVAAGSNPLFITTGPDGNLWFTEGDANKIARMTTSGTVTEFTIPTANALPLYITAGTDGNLWFTEYSANQIGRITPSGVVTEFPLPTAKAYPSSIVQGPDGAFWFTEGHVQNSAVGRITTGGTVTEYATPTTNAGPGEITVGPDGNLWFTEGQANKIARMTTSGTITDFPVPTAGSAPSGIAAGPDGTLWFTETNAYGAIGRITTSGIVTEFALAWMNFTLPLQIVAGDDGNLWFTEMYGNKMGRISTTGTAAEFPLATAGAQPHGITKGPDGAVWFTEVGASKVGRISP